ncbi:hypothetical protein [Paenisporosarcina sp. NPDC076898]|uniref:hypothetical protein n=1 Tax=unclassified Paenisporosarcina TaxID=2642018 RepID=UPI003CFF535E
MKKVNIKIFSVILLLILTGCNQDNKPGGNENEKSVFSEKDKEKAMEMINSFEGNLISWESETNQAISKGEIDIGDNDMLVQKANEKSGELVIKSFLEKYPNSLIENRGDLKVTFNPLSAEDCSFGNCNYDAIEAPVLKINEEKWETYHSDEFNITELVFTDIKISYPSKEESESTSISFVKDDSGNLYFSFNPIVNSLNFNLEELDQELISIKSEVPQDEVKAAQEEYKKEVKEMLSNFPELQ